MIWRHSSAILVIFGTYFFSEYAQAVCPPPPPLPTKDIPRLRQILFCDYDRNSRPVKNFNSTVTIGLSFALNDITADGHSGFIEVEGIMRMSWQDENIKWNAREYHGLNNIIVDSSEVWVPDLTVNIVSQNNIEELKPSTCVVSANGLVSCLPKVTIKSPCKQDVRLWPYDKHNCSFFLSSYLHYEHELNITVKPMELGFFKPNAEWDLMGTQIYRKLYNFSSFGYYYPVLEFNFLIGRHGGTLAAATVLPAVAMLMLLLGTFWMGTMVICRVVIGGFVIVANVTFLNYLLYLVPPNSDVVPVIVTLFRDCLCLSVFAMIIAVSIKRMIASQSQPPMLISTIIEKIELSVVSRILFLENATPSRDDEAAILETNIKPSPWALFAVLLDRLSFIICSVVTIVLFLGYIP